MKVKLNIFLPTVVVLLMLAVPAYAHPNDSNCRETSENPLREKSTSVELADRAKLGSEIAASTAAENPVPTSETAATKDSLVSKWLEARATEEAGSGKSSVEAAMFPIDEGEETMGGGWCNQCGCWMRHGCDPNGNCHIGHYSACQGSGCYLHSGSCISTG